MSEQPRGLHHDMSDDMIIENLEFNARLSDRNARDYRNASARAVLKGVAGSAGAVALWAMSAFFGGVALSAINDYRTANPGHPSQQHVDLAKAKCAKQFEESLVARYKEAIGPTLKDLQQSSAPSASAPSLPTLPTREEMTDCVRKKSIAIAVKVASVGTPIAAAVFGVLMLAFGIGGVKPAGWAREKFSDSASYWKTARGHREIAAETRNEIMGIKRSAQNPGPSEPPAPSA